MANVDSDGLAALYEQYRPLLWKLARRYRARAEMDDLMQMAFLGLYAAAQSFNPDMGVKFITYLIPCVKRAIMRELDITTGPLIMPKGIQAKIRAYRQAQGRLAVELMRKPYPWELARVLDMATKDIERLEAVIYAADVLQLDAPIGEDGDITAGDTVADDTALDFIQDGEQAELRRELWPIVAGALTEQESGVIVGRFIEERALKDLAGEYGVTPERVRQITGDALRKLRRNGKIKRLWADYGYGFYHVGVMEFNTTWTSSVEAEVLRLEEQGERWLAEIRVLIPPREAAL